MTKRAVDIDRGRGRGHGRLGTALLPALVLAGAAMATEDTIVVPDVRQIVEVRDVRVQADQVSGVLVNLSSKAVSHVQLEVTQSWLWTNERHPGENENNPERAVVHLVPSEISPGGHLPFTFQTEAPPQRTDGRFETSVTVLSLEQAG